MYPEALCCLKVCAHPPAVLILCLMAPLSILSWFFTSPQGGLLTYAGCLTGLVSAFNGAPLLHHAVLLQQRY